MVTVTGRGEHPKLCQRWMLQPPTYGNFRMVKGSWEVSIFGPRKMEDLALPWSSSIAMDSSYPFQSGAALSEKHGFR